MASLQQKMYVSNKGTSVRPITYNPELFYWNKTLSDKVKDALKVGIVVGGMVLPAPSSNHTSYDTHPYQGFKMSTKLHYRSHVHLPSDTSALELKLDKELVYFPLDFPIKPQ